MTLVERLRRMERYTTQPLSVGDYLTFCEAADRIEALEREQSRILGIVGGYTGLDVIAASRENTASVASKDGEQ